MDHCHVNCRILIFLFSILLVDVGGVLDLKTNQSSNKVNHRHRIITSSLELPTSSGTCWLTNHGNKQTHKFQIIHIQIVRTSVLLIKLSKLGYIWTYGPKYANCWPSQLHLLDHSTGIPHISSNLFTDILWLERRIRWVLLYSSKDMDTYSVIGANLIKSTQFALNSSSTSWHLCLSLPFVYRFVPERSYSTNTSIQLS